MDIIGSFVKGTVDRPLGSSHPRYPDMKYTVNYGYVDGEMMNMLMTSVEKIFLNLDPNTGVKTYDLDFKVHHSLF